MNFAGKENEKVDQDESSEEQEKPAETTNTKANDVWLQRGFDFEPGSTAAQVEILPPGLYSFNAHPFGWYLRREAVGYEFPYKIYGQHDGILNRVKTAWHRLSGNLGVLLNGVKGTGKTVTAQLLANWATQEGHPVLVLNRPVENLSKVLACINQDAVVIFDEFEKTHEKKEDQQALLSTIDGMSRSLHKRLFIFTTNEKTVETNFIDRPSRIRYCWEFGRLQEEVIEELLGDLLDPELARLRGDIVTYLNTRKVLSIDVAKSVINEVNTFRESPHEFASVLNLTEQEANGFTIDFLDAQRQVIKNFDPWFTPNVHSSRLLRLALTRSGREAVLPTIRDHGSLSIQNRSGSSTIALVEATDDPNEWICEMHVSFFDTWVRRFGKVSDAHYDDSVWIDVKPEGWEPPEWAKKMQAGKKLTAKEQQAFDVWRDARTVYGGEKHATFLLRIEPNFNAPARPSGMNWGALETLV